MTLCHSRAMRKTAVMGGARYEEMAWMYRNSCGFLKLRMTGIHSTLTATRMMTVHRPTTISSKSEAFLRISFQMSMVKMVEAELKMEVREDMRAANITANIIPLKPVVDELASIVHMFDNLSFLLQLLLQFKFNLMFLLHCTCG